MVVVQKLKETEITEQDSLLLTRNLLRIAIFNISYIRGLFPENYFNDKAVPALEMKIKKLMPMDAESRRLIDWMEKGVYDALQKKYLKTLLFCVCEEIEGPMIEEYSFSFCYPNSDSQEVSMNINRTGNKKQGANFKSNTSADITPTQMRSSACKMVRTLVQLMRTLDRMPEERTILMKLFYYEDVTPVDYEPPFFKCCSEQEANNEWTKNPLRMEVGNVNSRHFVLALKVKSVLDPCQDENNDSEEDDDVSTGADSMQMNDSSDSETEDNHSLEEEDRYIVARVEPQLPKEENDMPDHEDDTQDEKEDENQLARVRDWISSRHVDVIEITDVLSNFPDISVALIEDIMDKLLKEEFLSRTGRDTYTINTRKQLDPDFAMKEEMDIQENNPIDWKAHQGEDVDYMYMKALYHALPMKYITVPNLQSKLEGEANQTAVRKLINKMVEEGFVEGKGNRRLGKRVIQSELTNKKLVEVKNTLNNKLLEMEVSRPENRSSDGNFLRNGNDHKDMSTCGGLHSVGSDVTRSERRSDILQKGSTRTDQAKMQEQGNTPISRTEQQQPVASRESGVSANGRMVKRNEGDNNTISSRSTQDKRSRRASMVKEPIFQNLKRQKSEGPLD